MKAAPRLTAVILSAVAPVFAAAAGPPALSPLVADVLSSPVAVPGSDGARHLLYELRIENITPGRFVLKRITVIDQDGSTLAQLDEQAVGNRFSLGGRRGSETATLAGAQFGVAFLHVRLGAKVRLPASLAHRIEGHSETAAADFSITAARSAVLPPGAVSLGVPLRGEGYVAADGCCDSIRHVRALLPLDGHFYLAQRFAIDWERIDASGRVFVGDARSVRSYRIYGEPVLAVADATVVAARNDLEDQVPGKLPAGLPLDEADGNFAILELAPAVYALYAHMRKGTVAVHPGQRVRRGEQLGNVGNSGNTQAPHLHFQLMSEPSALAADGLPYTIDDYIVSAVDRAGTADFDRAEATGAPMSLTPLQPPAHVRGRLPLDLCVVEFPGTGARTRAAPRS